MCITRLGLANGHGVTRFGHLAFVCLGAPPTQQLEVATGGLQRPTQLGRLSRRLCQITSSLVGRTFVRGYYYWYPSMIVVHPSHRFPAPWVALSC
jgi:hypothetical protein